MAQPNPAVAEANVRGEHNASWASQQAMTQTRRDNQRHLPPPRLRQIQDLSERTRVYLYNVGPWAHQRLMGSLGTYHIPACPEGGEFSAPVMIEGIVSEMYPMLEGRMDYLPDEDGWNIAMQVLGVGPHLPPRNSFVPYGVFASRSNPPAKEEMKEARRNLWEKYRELVAEADIAYSQGPKAAEETIRPDTHFVAARALRKTEAECPWMKNSAAPAERAECPSCTAVYKVGAMKCRECGYVLDKIRYDKAVKEGLFATA